MQYRPSSKELLVTVQELLMKEILPKIEDDELLSYKTLVSWNMLGVIIREMANDESQIETEYESFQKLSLGHTFNILSDFKLLPRKEKIKEINLLNRKLADTLRNNKEASIRSAEWAHIKLVLKNNLSVSNPRFAV